MHPTNISAFALACGMIDGQPHIAEDTAICRNPQIHSFMGGKKKHDISLIEQHISMLHRCENIGRNSGTPRNFFSGGGQQIQLRTENRENGDLGV